MNHNQGVIPTLAPSDGWPLGRRGANAVRDTLSFLRHNPARTSPGVPRGSVRKQQ